MGKGRAQGSPNPITKHNSLSEGPGGRARGGGGRSISHPTPTSGGLAMISLEGLFFQSQWVAFETCCEEIKKGKGAAWERGGESWEGGEVGGGVAGLEVSSVPQTGGDDWSLTPLWLGHQPSCRFSFLHPSSATRH